MLDDAGKNTRSSSLVPTLVDALRVGRSARERPADSRRRRTTLRGGPSVAVDRGHPGCPRRLRSATLDLHRAGGRPPEPRR